MDNKYVKRCSTSLAITEMKIKTMMRYHYTAMRTPEIESIDYQTVGEDVEKLDLSYIALRNGKWYNN